MKKKMSILVYSCWKNRDMWETFSILFQKYWKDCPYPLVLVTDKYYHSDNHYVFDKVIEKDASWGTMIKEAIQKSNSEYVMLWMDDYLLCDYIVNDDLQRQVERASFYHAANLRLIESPICKGIYLDNSNIGYYQLGEAYALSTQIGIWDAQFLYNLIQDKWSAWEFERKASLEQKDFSQPILVALDYVFPYEEGVRKGKWMEAGAKLCKRNGIKLDEKIRPVMSNKEMAKIYLQGAVLDWNSTLVVKIQNLLGKFKIR